MEKWKNRLCIFHCGGFTQRPNGGGGKTGRDKNGGKKKSKRCTCPSNKEWGEKVAIRAKSLKSMTKTNSYVPQDTLTSRRRIYFIHDNGGRPFKFVANDTGIDIFTYPDVEVGSDDDWFEKNKFNPNNYTIHILTIPSFQGYWRGYDTSPYMMHSNSILVHLGPKRYIFAGLAVIQFTTKDNILDYVSYVGNSDVPYPIAYGVDNIYFILDGAYIRRRTLEKDMVISVGNAEKIYFDGMYGTISKGKWKYRNFKMSNVKRLIDRR